MRSARPPTVQPKVSNNPRTHARMNVIPAELVLRLTEKCENHGNNRSHRCDDQRPRSPAVDERGCAQIGGKRFSVCCSVCIVSH